MKKLEKLGISPTPWRIADYGDVAVEGGTHGIVDNNGNPVVETDGGFYPPMLPDARLIVAAPKMYKKAWELITAFDKRMMTPKHVEALRSALAEAAGESEVKK